MIASLIIGIKIAFAMKPGESLDCVTSGSVSLCRWIQIQSIGSKRAKRAEMGMDKM